VLRARSLAAVDPRWRMFLAWRALEEHLQGMRVSDDGDFSRKAAKPQIVT